MRTLIESEEHWHRLRAQNIGGSEVAALFDCSPYVTAFSLHHRKAGNVTENNAGNSRTNWGKRPEPAIAEGVAEEMRWVLRKSREYHTHDQIKGWGCTVDYDVIDHKDGPGIDQPQRQVGFAGARGPADQNPGFPHGDTGGVNQSHSYFLLGDLMRRAA